MNGVVVAETVRRCVTSIAYWLFVGLAAIVAFGLARFDRPGTAWPSLMSLLAFVIGCTPIGPEFSSGTLQLILTKPVNRAVYLLSRVAGATAAVWIATVIAFLFEIIGRAIWVPELRLDYVGSVLIHSFADTILICALLAFFGSFTRAYFNLAIYFVLMIGLGVGQGMLSMFRSTNSALGNWLYSHAIVEQSVAAVSRNLFPDAPPLFDWRWLLMVLSNAALALVAACFIFRNREVPYGAD